MFLEEKGYLQALSEVKANGYIKQGRLEQENTKSLFGVSLSFDMSEGQFPVFTSRKMFVRGAFEEFMFFLNGLTDTNILYNKGIKYWKDNTSREALDKASLYMLPEGEMGCGYGHQWRNFNGSHPLIPETWDSNYDFEDNAPYDEESYNPPTLKKGFDQIEYVLKLLKENSNSRRIMFTNWCPNQLHLTPLPPCPSTYTFTVTNNFLNLMVTQRSGDMFHGIPFDIIIVAFMLQFFAQYASLKPGRINYHIADAHIYESHFEAVEELLLRKPSKEIPELIIQKQFNVPQDIYFLTYNEIKLINYNPQGSINVPMVP